MKDKILQFCRRQNKCTADEIALLIELDQEDVKYILEELVKENKLTKINEQYCYKKQEKNIDKYVIFQYHSREKIDLIIKSFCLLLPAYKAARLADVDDNTAERFYHIFREVIYKRQYDLLLQNYKESPQIVRNRIFLDKEVYFYTYKNQVFITKNPLKNINERNFEPEEIKEFKKVYSYLTRCINHSKQAINIEEKLSDFIWRRNKNFNELYYELNKILNISSFTSHTL